MNGKAVDLHIHSCVSPCAEDDMTPLNIVGMARLKGLDVIAVSDHNCAANLPAVMQAAKAANLAVLPAMELESREEVHLLAYFRALDEAMDFYGAIKAHLPGIPNRPEFFGNQRVMDARDRVAGEIAPLLIQPLDIPLNDLTDMVISAGGLAVPAHVNREGNGLLSLLGMIPPGAPYAALEIWRRGAVDPVAVAGYRHIFASDAHRLGDILEREMILPLINASADAAYDYLAERTGES